MLVLAREQDLQSVLPLALYECCRIMNMAVDPSIMNLLGEALPRDDGTNIFLSIHDQIICLSCRPRLLKLQHNTTFAWMDNEAEAYRTMDSPCIYSPKCASMRSGVLRALFVTDCNLDGLEPTHEIIAIYKTIKCIPCSEILIRMHTVGRRDFWEKLPLTFGLPEWQELRDERVECVSRFCILVR